MGSSARSASVAPGRPPRGKGQRLTLAERYRLVELHKAHPEWSSRQLAAAADVGHETARLAILTVKQTPALMAASAADALDYWRTASHHAAARGDHRPSRDWLLHAGSIEPLPSAGKGAGPALVIINAPLPGMPGWTPPPTIDTENPTAPHGAPDTPGHSDTADPDRKR